jgi:hypothetical protein
VPSYVICSKINTLLIMQIMVGVLGIIGNLLSIVWFSRIKVSHFGGRIQYLRVARNLSQMYESCKQSKRENENLARPLEGIPVKSIVMTFSRRSTFYLFYSSISFSISYSCPSTSGTGVFTFILKSGCSTFHFNIS